jgi:hypothetical protein
MNIHANEIKAGDLIALNKGETPHKVTRILRWHVSERMDVYRDGAERMALRWTDTVWRDN